MYYIMCLGLLYFLGSHGQKTQAWGASLTRAGYVGHTSFSQDHFVINIECAGSVAQCCDPSVPGRMLLMSHGAHWLHVCTAPGRSSGPSLQLCQALPSCAWKPTVGDLLQPVLVWTAVLTVLTLGALCSWGSFQNACRSNRKRWWRCRT